MLPFRSPYLLLSLGLLLPLPAALATDPPPTQTSAHDLAYSLGASLGERLRQEAPGLQVQALLDGMRQAYQGEPLALKKEQIEKILAEHDAQAEDQGDPGDAPPAQGEDALNAERRFMVTEKTKVGVHELAEGILATELIHGSGALPSTTGRVQVRYVGRLPDGSIFDQAQDPTWFRLDSVIAGWRIALQQMPVGSKWRIVVPSAQAYGADGAGDLIPPFTPLVFELELLGTGE